MNELGIHAMVWSADWPDERLEWAIRSTKECGYDFLELPLSGFIQQLQTDPSIFDVDRARSLLQEYGLGITTGIGLPTNADVASPDPEIAQRGKALLLDAIACTKQLGATFLGGVTHGALVRPSGPPDPGTMHRVADALREVADVASESGITLGLEVVNRYESSLLNTCEQGLRLSELIDRENVGVHADTYHMNIEECDTGRALRNCGDRLRYVHIGESHRGTLGTGNIDFSETFRALASLDYQGRIAVESFSSAVLPQASSTRLAVWRPMWKDAIAFASHARSFMQDQLTAASRCRLI